MGIALDLSSKWNLPCSMQIARSLEPYGILYLEDPMLPDNLEAYASLARETSIPVCISERLSSRFRFREMFERRAVDVCMFDVTWCGGISEAKKIADMADTHKIPASPHTGGGPLLWFASIHTATALTNFYIMESVYHLYNDLYPHFIQNVPVPEGGFVTAPEGPDSASNCAKRPFAMVMPWPRLWPKPSCFRIPYVIGRSYCVRRLPLNKKLLIFFIAAAGILPAQRTVKEITKATTIEDDSKANSGNVPEVFAVSGQLSGSSCCASSIRRICLPASKRW